MAKKKEPTNLMPAELKKSLLKTLTEQLTLTFQKIFTGYKKITSRIR